MNLHPIRSIGDYYRKKIARMAQQFFQPFKPFEFLSRLGIIIQCHTDGTSVVAVVLPDDLLAV